MQPESAKWLEDIRDCASFILEMTRGKSVSALASDRMLRQAVERNFEIIGEALNRAGRADPSIAAGMSEFRQIVAFRNVLIHGYDQVDVEIVWSVIEQRLPILLQQVMELLRASS